MNTRHWRKLGKDGLLLNPTRAVGSDKFLPENAEEYAAQLERALPLRERRARQEAKLLSMQHAAMRLGGPPYFGIAPSNYPADDAWRRIPKQMQYELDRMRAQADAPYSKAMIQHWLETNR